MERFKKGPWSKEEDAVLRDWVAAYGPQNWSCIQSNGLLMRTGKSCRLRWVNILRPGLKKGRKFSPEEEEGVVRLQAQFGNKWARIAEFFPGRTDNDVKNLWSMCKKRLARRQQGPLPISRSQTGVHRPEPLVPPNELSTCEALTDYQQQDKDITANYQETMGTLCINQCLNAISGTPVLTRPTGNPSNTNTTVLSEPFVEVLQCEQCMNVTSAAPVLALPTSNPPGAKSEPSPAPLNSIMPHQKFLKCTSVSPVLTVPTPSTPNIKGGPSSELFNGMTAVPVLALSISNPPNTKSEPSPAPADSIMPHQQCLDCTSVKPVLTVPGPSTPNIKGGSSAFFDGTTPEIQSPFFDDLFETEPHYCSLDCNCRGTISGPLIFEDLTASVLEFFDPTL